MRLINIIIAVILFMGNAAFADYKAGKAAYDAGDYEAAYNQLLPLAEAGDAKAQNAIGIMFDRGHGVNKSLNKAIEYYSTASNIGNYQASLNLGISLLARPTSSKEEQINGIVAILKATSMKVKKAEQALQMVQKTVPHNYMIEAYRTFKNQNNSN